ncbi:MAG: GerAB/ArcD/ProY family transporter, partial [Eubacteriales bacterium]|nr:GerAB/ArcD/ProY family transporter [Eubacteriales bacterium]
GIDISANVMRYFTEFFHIVTLLETPQLIILILLTVTTVYLAKRDVTLLGKMTLLAVPVVVLVIVLTSLFSLKQVRPEYLLPVLNHSPREIADASYSAFCAPFGASVLFLGVADSIKKKESPYRIYLTGTLLAAALLLVATIRNILILGGPMLSIEYFPSYIAARTINIGEFFVRIEGSISMNFLLSGLVKITIALTATARGITKLFNLPDEKAVMLPAGLLCMAVCSVFYNSTMHIQHFFQYYKMYASLFQIYLPMFFWLAGEIHVRRRSLV